jgi:hypothetical protein
MQCQDYPDIRRDKLLEQLIDIGVYNRTERLDLNNDLADTGGKGSFTLWVHGGFMVGFE